MFAYVNLNRISRNLKSLNSPLYETALEDARSVLAEEAYGNPQIVGRIRLV